MTNIEIIKQVRATANRFLGGRFYLREHSRQRLTLTLLFNQDMELVAKLGPLCDQLIDQGLDAYQDIHAKEPCIRVALNGPLEMAPADIQPVGQAVIDNPNWLPRNGRPIRFTSKKYVPFEEVLTKDWKHKYYWLFSYVGAKKQDMPRVALLREDGKVRIRADVHKQHCDCYHCRDLRCRRAGTRLASVQDVLDRLVKHQKRVERFYDDPMTQAYGVPTDDFQRDFDKKERAILAQLEERALLAQLEEAARAAGDDEALRIALAGYEKWML